MSESDPVVEALTQAKIKLLFDQPFVGQLTTRFKFIEASKWLGTAATDGRNFYYNREFIKKLEPSELMFLLSHELFHCVFDHVGRKNPNQDSDIWNMAADYIINYVLVTNKVGKMLNGGLFDEKYNDTYTTDQLYELLKKNSVKIKMPMDEHLQLTPGGSNGKGKGDGDNSVTVTVMGDENGPPTLTEDDLTMIKNELKADLLNAAISCAGSMPLGIKRFIDGLIEPKLNWREMLEMHIKSAVKDDYSFTKLSRKSWASGCVLPGMVEKTKIDIVCAIDTSGSMTEEMLRDMLSEVHGIMCAFDDFVLRIFTFDTKVYNDEVFAPDNLDDIHRYPMAGSGGTSFEAIFQHLKDNEIDPHKLVIFTDGYPNGSWGDEDFCDTMFIIHSTQSIEAPYGQTVYYD